MAPPPNSYVIYVPICHQYQRSLESDHLNLDNSLSQSIESRLLQCCYKFKTSYYIYFNQFQGLGYVILFHYGFGSYTVKVELGSMYLENNQNLKHFL